MKTTQTVEERLEALQIELDAQNKSWAELSKQIEATDTEIHLTELPEFDITRRAPAIGAGIRV